MAEQQPDIQIFNETTLSLPVTHAIFRATTSQIAHHEECNFKLLEIVYVEEDEIVRINEEHLKRDYVTDIITFRYDDDSENKEIEGTLFCCAPRIREQAKEFDESIEKEFLRIFIHGLLHLCGYEDKSNPQKQQMTTKENFYLDLVLQNP